MYKYYEEIESGEHYLYASEVAEILMKNHGIVSMTGCVPTTMVAGLLDALDDRRLFYNTRRGIRRVYTWGNYLANTLCYSRDGKLMLDTTPGDHITEPVNGKRWKYKVLEDSRERLGLMDDIQRS